MVMRNLNSVFILIGILLISSLISCKKDDPIKTTPPPPEPPGHDTLYTPIADTMIQVGFDTIPPPDTTILVEGYDTIFPLSYFPAYPGSYWEYIDTDSNTSIKKTDPEYILDYYVLAGYYSDTFYVPVYASTPIWGYAAHTGGTSYNGIQMFKTILSETEPVGYNWRIYFWSGQEVRRKIIAKDASIVIQNQVYEPTIVVLEYQPNWYWYEVAKRYYTKDIGLVKEELYNNSGSIYLTRYISDYYINN